MHHPVKPACVIPKGTVGYQPNFRSPVQNAH